MRPLPFELRASFLAHGARDARWAAWVAGVPRTLADLLEGWDLSVDGQVMHGHTALAVPVRAGGQPSVLKIGWPHDERRPAAKRDATRTIAPTHPGHGGPQLMTLGRSVARWTDDLRAMPRNGPIPRRIVEQAARLADDVVADQDGTSVLVHGDLH